MEVLIMKQPHEKKAVYKNVKDILEEAHGYVNGKYIDKKTKKEITYPISIPSDRDNMVDKLTEQEGVLKDIYDNTKTEKSKEKNKGLQDEIESMKEILRAKS